MIRLGRLWISTLAVQLKGHYYMMINLGSTDRRDVRRTGGDEGAHIRPYGPEWILGLLHKFKSACNIKGINEEPATWFFPQLIRKSAAAALTARLSLKSQS